MDFTQERIATLHDFGAADPEAPVDRTTVVVPMTEREYASRAAERVLVELERADPARVVVPLRSPAGTASAFANWLASFDLPLDVVWCSGPRVEAALADAGLDGRAGKGRDVWLGLGAALASDSGDYVVFHDADAATYEARDVRKLVHPLARGYQFSKGYYARVETDHLYGRLCRLFYEPAVAALADAHDAPVVSYLGAFRYALAGECAMTVDVARSVRVQREWGLEVGLLGEAFDAAGRGDTAQVDLGRYEHDHRGVAGADGLAEMSRGVSAALFRVVEDHGVDVDYDALSPRYRETGAEFARGYAADAAFNGLTYDREDELAQVELYADAVAPPGPDARLPAWADAPVDPSELAAAAAADLDAARSVECGVESD